MDFPQFLGDYLLARRNQFNITLAEVERDTGIRPEYIDALEKQEFKRLPADIYLFPIVKTYSHYLGLDEREIIHRLKEEKEHFAKIQAQKTHEDEELLSNTKPITGKKIFLGLAASMLSLIAFYITQQFFNVSSPPNLVIYEPANGVNTNNNNILVKGKTSNNSKIELNGKTISTDNEGNFNIPVNLNTGENHIAIVAISNNGQKIGENLLVYANPPSTPETSPDRISKDSLTMDITANEITWISLKTDGETVQKTLNPGDKETVSAKDIDLLAGNAGGITIALNGSTPTLLGEKGQVIRKHYSWNDFNLSYLTPPSQK